MAIYASNMIRQYESAKDVLVAPPKGDYSRYKTPVGSIGAHHNLNGFELSLKQSQLPKGTRQVITLHDCQEFQFPQNFSNAQISEREEVYNWIRHNKPAVICISEFTKNELIKRATLPEEILHVIPHGFDHLVEWEANASTSSWYSQQQYIYVPGKAWKHKGHLHLLKEMADRLSFFRENNLKVYFACNPNDIGEELLYWIKEYKANDVLVVIPNMSNEQHVQIMRNARLILLPSVYEGFGLSYGESVFMNKKVVAFNLQPYLEVSNAGVFVDVGNYRELLDKTIEVYESNKTEDEDKTIHKFTWKNNARRVLELVTQ